MKKESKFDKLLKSQLLTIKKFMDCMDDGRTNEGGQEFAEARFARMAEDYSVTKKALESDDLIHKMTVSGANKKKYNPLLY